MPERSIPDSRGAADAKDRFDGESARRVLERASVEQHRLNEQRAGSFSVNELEEIAAEAGISGEALHAAIDAERRRAPPNASRTASTSRTKRLILTSACAVALVSVLFAFPAVAQVLFWSTMLALLVLSVLVLLGASPF